MPDISASMVKELREKTDAPMMECKKALTEAEGDLEKAEEILRVRLGSKASKAASRVAAEGVVAIATRESLAAIVELNCETDFVAKNDDFLGFAADLARIAMDQASVTTVDTLSAQPLSGQTVEEVRTALVGKLGENVSVRRFQRIEAKGRFYTYIHGGAKIGVLLDLVGGDETLGRDIAMHIAASKPRSLDSSGVDVQLIEAERRVAKEKAAESGKSPEIAEKMVEGAVQKFLKEVTLLGQVFVKAEDGKQTIEQLLKAKSASIASFVLYIVGEGIEKKQSDFAAEVAAQSAAARAA
ncbi:MAG: translation elongation factor Ts [Proteobacteria bacterium]|jgi:elongation factor Ts|nr:translation elongation factor Ts [Pseudomonadota bacterium]MDA1187842.1 translation elongation factor Ts [Pseudomonadota bacterium]